jgi:hypothetical protein
MDDVVKQWVIEQQIPLPELCQRLYIPFRCHNYLYIYGSQTQLEHLVQILKKQFFNGMKRKNFHV